MIAQWIVGIFLAAVMALPIYLAVTPINTRPPAKDEAGQVASDRAQADDTNSTQA